MLSHHIFIRTMVGRNARDAESTKKRERERGLYEVGKKSWKKERQLPSRGGGETLKNPLGHSTSPTSRRVFRAPTKLKGGRGERGLICEFLISWPCPAVDTALVECLVTDVHLPRNIPRSTAPALISRCNDVRLGETR